MEQGAQLRETQPSYPTGRPGRSIRAGRRQVHVHRHERQAVRGDKTSSGGSYRSVRKGRLPLAGEPPAPVLQAQPVRSRAGLRQRSHEEVQPAGMIRENALNAYARLNSYAAISPDGKRHIMIWRIAWSRIHADLLKRQNSEIAAPFMQKERVHQFYID